ncbi:MAG TPA: hypothetical protein ENG84_05960 [Gammaproteobacteria bacterium]|nr:hypothetical protein [Gammaproteobacteria bacterium]HDO34110.1 hypothetical protein [Chromatiales bacterium]
MSEGPGDRLFSRRLRLRLVHASRECLETGISNRVGYGRVHRTQRRGQARESLRGTAADLRERRRCAADG